jgi:predicted PurR-regulated permease PerM
VRLARRHDVWHHAAGEHGGEDTPLREQQPEVARTTLSVLFIGALIAGSAWILWPFVPAFVWAVMIVVSTWPILRRVQQILWGRRGPAVAVMCVALLAILIAPLGIAIDAILSNAERFSVFRAWVAEAHLPLAPHWLAALPVVGSRAADAWNKVAAAGAAGLWAHVSPYVGVVVGWFAQRAGGVALVLVQFVLVVILSAVLYANGEAWAVWVRRFSVRLAGEQGDRMVVLAGQAIRGVALGVVVTALAQATLGGIGLAVAGIPFVAVLTAIMFMLCIAQVGPILVLLGATAWVYSHSGVVGGTLMLLWSFAVGLMDNFLRPILIRRGADLPLLLIITGVVGGLIAFGIIGIFVGPVLLAVAYKLLDDWVGAAPHGRHTAAPG